MPTKDPVKKAKHLRTWYENGGSVKIREGMKRSRERNARFVRSAKNKPCTDCGNSFPWYAMHFDHVGDDKEHEVSRLMNSGASIAKIEAEIAKCEVVCATCHAIRTYERLLKLKPHLLLLPQEV